MLFVLNRYVFQTVDEQTKNHQTDDSKRQGRMYEVKGHPLCPVRSFERYLALLNKGSNILFQYPMRQTNDDSCWYCARPLGHNALGSMMSVISTAAGLSQKYTNHCLRATSVTVLDSSHFPGRHIMTISGHKSETSLKHYSHRTNEETKRSMSTALNKSLGLDDVRSVEQNVSALSHVSSPLADVGNLQVTDLEISDEILATITLPEITSCQSVSTSGQSVSTSSSHYHWDVPIAPNISSSNVTINYNLYNKL